MSNYVDQFLFYDAPVGKLSYSPEFPIFDVVSLCMFLGTTPDELRQVITHIPKMYSRFFIDKDTGKITSKNAGVRLREINAPKEPLKSWQLKLLDIFVKFPKHPANTAFMEGCSVVNAAKTAVHGDVLVHIDVKDFFPSHTALYIKRRLDALITNTYGVKLKDEVLSIITKLVCHQMQLPQGSACSPMLTIILNYDLDQRITQVAEKYDLQYHRYADDMWFTGVQPDDVIQEFLYELQDALHPFRMNYSKTNIMRTRAYPKFKGVKLKINQYIPSSQAAKLIHMVVETLKFTKHVASVNSKAITVEGIPTPQLPIEDLKQLLVTLSTTISARYPALKFECRPIWYYIQSTKKCLGLNIVDGKVLYPRKRYNDLRMEAMLLGRQRALFSLYFAILKYFDVPSSSLKPQSTAPFIYAGLHRTGRKNFRNLLTAPLNRRVFMGRVAYLRSIDPEKADKIMKIEADSYTKCINGYSKWYQSVNIDMHPDVTWVNDLVPLNAGMYPVIRDAASDEELAEILSNAEISPWAV